MVYCLRPKQLLIKEGPIDPYVKGHLLSWIKWCYEITWWEQMLIPVAEFKKSTEAFDPKIKKQVHDRVTVYVECILKEKLLCDRVITISHVGRLPVHIYSCFHRTIALGCCTGIVHARIDQKGGHTKKLSTRP